MAEFTVTDLVEAEEPKVPFVNLDAKFLFDLAVEMEGGEGPDETTMRLRIIAKHLESIDSQLMALKTDDRYTAGILEGKRRYLMRSNLPLQSVELTPDLAKAVAAFPKDKIKRFAKGKRSTDEPPKPSVLAAAGIKLDLSSIGAKK